MPRRCPKTGIPRAAGLHTWPDETTTTCPARGKVNVPCTVSCNVPGKERDGRGSSSIAGSAGRQMGECTGRAREKRAGVEARPGSEERQRAARDSTTGCPEGSKAPSAQHQTKTAADERGTERARGQRERRQGERAGRERGSGLAAHGVVQLAWPQHASVNLHTCI